MQYILNDAQTSGGLLVSVPASTVDAVLDSLRACPLVQVAALIGHFVETPSGHSPCIHALPSPSALPQ